MTAPERALRLMFVVPSAQRTGGGDVWLEQLLPHLRAAGTAIAVVFERDGELAAGAASQGCTTVVLPKQDCSASGDDALSELVAPLAGVLGDYQPDVTVFWSPRAQLYGSRAHALAGHPGGSAWVQHVLPSTFWLHRKASAAPTGLVICVSSAVSRRQRGLYPRYPTRVVHPGLDRPPATSSRGAAREQLGCTTAERLIGIVGRVEPWKGQDIAVRMLAELADPDAHLILFGQRRSPTWPRFGDQVEQLARDLGVAGRITFAGHRCDVTQLLPALDVVVCSSRQEGFGLAILEAMAAGVPVVATRCGGPEDIVLHEASGLLVPVDDPAALAGAVRRVLGQPHLVAALTARARSVWRERFTAGCSAGAFLAVTAAVADMPRAEAQPGRPADAVTRRRRRAR